MLYEGQENLANNALAAYPKAYAEYQGFWRALASSSVQPNVLRTLREGSLFYFRVANNLGDAALALLDETGDLRFLDVVVDMLEASKQGFETDFKPMPNGQKARAWERNSTWRLPGKRRWLYYGSPNNPGGIDPEFYGTDLSQNNVLAWHACVARIVIALKANRGKTSPKRYDYTTHYTYWRTYLLEDFEGLWQARNSMNFIGEMYRTVMGRLAYHRAMQLLEGRASDATRVNTTQTQRRRDELTFTHDGTTIRSYSHFSELGSTSRQPPFIWQLTDVTHYTVGHALHLHLMGTTDFTSSYMTSIANMLYYAIMIDGPNGNVAIDTGGGGIPSSGATRAQLRTRDGGVYAARHLLSTTVRGRYSANASIQTGLWLAARYGPNALLTDLTTLRNRFSPLATGSTHLEKAALCLAWLSREGYTRNGDLPTQPPPNDPQPPPYHDPSGPPPTERFFPPIEVDMADPLPDFNLLPDRVDYDPSDPETYRPQMHIPAYIPNEIIQMMRYMHTTVNQLQQERGEGGTPPPTDPTDPTPPPENAPTPDSVLRYILFGRTGAFLVQNPINPSNNLSAAKLHRHNGLAMTEEGLQMRSTSAAGPQYCMTDVIEGFNMRDPFCILALVKGVTSAGVDAAYMSAANSLANDGYLIGRQNLGDFEGVYRTTGSTIWDKTLDTPASPLRLDGAGWRLLKIAKLGDNFAITNVNRLVLGDTPNKARRSYSLDIGTQFATSGNRIGSGLVPRVQPGTGLIGMGNFTLGALILTYGAMTDEETAVWYSVIRQAQINAGLSDVLSAPRI